MPSLGEGSPRVAMCFSMLVNSVVKRHARTGTGCHPRRNEEFSIQHIWLLERRGSITGLFDGVLLRHSSK